MAIKSKKDSRDVLRQEAAPRKSPKAVDGVVNGSATETAVGPEAIQTEQDVKNYLQSIRDRMGDDSAAPIYAMSALNQLMSSPDIYKLLSNENKEIARDIWLRIKQSGLHVRTPMLLFPEG